MRSTSQCKVGLHRSVSLDELREQSTHEIRRKIPFVESEGPVGQHTLKAKLEHLSQQIEREIEREMAAAEQREKSKADGHVPHYRLARRGSVAPSLAARQQGKSMASFKEGSLVHQNSDTSSFRRKSQLAAQEGEAANTDSFKRKSLTMGHMPTDSSSFSRKARASGGALGSVSLSKGADGKSAVAQLLFDRHA